MQFRRTLVTVCVSMTLFTPATLLAKPEQRPTDTPVAVQASDTAKLKSAAKPGKPVKPAKPVKVPPSVRPAQVPELDGASAGLALLLLGGMVLLLRETRQPA